MAHALRNASRPRASRSCKGAAGQSGLVARYVSYVTDDVVPRREPAPINKARTVVDPAEIVFLGKMAPHPDRDLALAAEARLEKLTKVSKAKPDPLPDPPVVLIDEMTGQRCTSEGATVLAQDPKSRVGHYPRRLLRTAAGGYALLLNDSTLKPLKDADPEQRGIGPMGHGTYHPDNDHSGTAEQEAVRIWQRMDEKLVPTLEEAFPDFAANLEDI